MNTILAMEDLLKYVFTERVSRIAVKAVLFVCIARVQRQNEQEKES
jgi:hypothetical protein